MKRFVHALAFCVLLFISQNGWAQFVCAYGGQATVYGPDSNCPLIISGSTTMHIDAALIALNIAQNIPVIASFSGDIGAVINDGTAVTSLPVCTTVNTSVVSPPPLHFNTNYTPGVHIFTTIFSACSGGLYIPYKVATLRINVPTPPPPPGTPVLIDPVAANLVQEGGHVSTNQDSLAQATQSVQGVAADNVTRVVVRIPAGQAGRVLTIAVMNDSNPSTTSNSTDNDGGLAPVGGSQLSSSLNVTAVDTSQGPMAFAVYRAPVNFSRGTTQDNGLDSRGVTLQVTAQDTGATSSAKVIIRRPPLVLIHGLWSGLSMWDAFKPLINGNNGDKRFFVKRIRYDSQIAGITATVPVYTNKQMAKIKANALGFAYNAPSVLKQVQDAINTFKDQFKVAAVQADVVVHSMGGDIVRTIASQTTFPSDDTFGTGSIDKLITIGTPHLGTPLAAQLLQNNNSCLRGILADGGDISLQTVTTTTVINGAVADLEENSAAIGNFQVGQVIPTAYIAGVVGTTNLSGLDCTTTVFVPCHAEYIRRNCPNDPLAQNFRSANWPIVFNQQPSDAIVPIASQINNSMAIPGLQFTGVIHSSGLTGLNFIGPAEAERSDIANKVIDLLNEKINGSDFHF